MRWFLATVLSLGFVCSSAQAGEDTDPCGKNLSLADELRRISSTVDPYLEERVRQEDALDKARENVRGLPRLLRKFASRKETQALLLPVNELLPGKDVYDMSIHYSFHNKNEPFLYIGLAHGVLVFGDSPSPIGNLVFEFCEENGLRCSLYISDGSVAKRRELNSESWIAMEHFMKKGKAVQGILIDWAPQSLSQK